MTTKWNPDGIWQGETVTIYAAHPDLTEEFATSVRSGKTIVANAAVKVAPWADMFVALDPDLPSWAAKDAAGFQGIAVCGVDTDLHDAMYAGMFYERAGSVEIRNNGLAALRIAFRAGAKRIKLVGFDTAKYEALHAHTGFRGLTEGLAQLVAEVRAAGVLVEMIEVAQKRRRTA